MRSGAASSEMRAPCIHSGPRLLGVFIHQVVPLGKCLLHDEGPKEEGDALLKALDTQGVHLVNSYVGAALRLHQREPDVVSLQQVSEVAMAAMDDFDTMRLIYPERAWEL